MLVYTNSHLNRETEWVSERSDEDEDRVGVLGATRVPDPVCIYIDKRGQERVADSIELEFSLQPPSHPFYPPSQPYTTTILFSSFTPPIYILFLSRLLTHSLTDSIYENIYIWGKIESNWYVARLRLLYCKYCSCRVSWMLWSMEIIEHEILKRQIIPPTFIQLYFVAVIIIISIFISILELCSDRFFIKNLKKKKKQIKIIIIQLTERK